MIICRILVCLYSMVFSVSFLYSSDRKNITNSIGIKLMYIPATNSSEWKKMSGGNDYFVMWSEHNVKWSEHNQGRRIKLTKPFYMASTEVTQEQWVKLMGVNPSFFKGRNLPVEQVSWNEVATFCKKLSHKEGKRYRLPTEAEWEYACRAGTTTPFNLGYQLSYKQANIHYRYRDEDVYLKKTVAVGSYKPNRWGLFDMHGNVWELCSDWYSPQYPNGTDPKGPVSGTKRVRRGGSWYNFNIHCRSDYRSRYSPDRLDSDIGFRLVLEIK